MNTNPSLQEAPESVSEAKPVHIVSLSVANVKRIKAARVEPTPGESLVLVGGANDQGKSTLLDSIIAVLGGKDASPSVPVRKGHRKGSVTLDLGELVAHLRFTAAGGRELVVEDKEGNRLASPQAVMNKLTGKVGFDAEDFIRRKPSEQLEILRKIVGIDFAPLEAKKRNLFEARTLANAEVRRLEAQLAGAPNPVNAPTSEIDSSLILQAIKDAQVHNDGRIPLNNAVAAAEANVRSCRTEFQGCVDEISELTGEILALETKLAALKGQLKTVTDDKEKAAADLEAAEKTYAAAKADRDAFQVKDLEGFQKQLWDLEAQNNRYRQAQARRQIQTDLINARRTAEGLSASIEDLEVEREQLLANAKFPVAGLSFNETGILFDGLPFDQASSSTKRKVSVAIGAALNPTLRVMIVKDGSLLDAKSLEQLRDLAKLHNLQVWVEIVTQGPDARCAVIIEDGEVLGAPRAPDEPPSESDSRQASPLQATDDLKALGFIGNN